MFTTLQNKRFSSFHQHIGCLDVKIVVRRRNYKQYFNSFFILGGNRVWALTPVQWYQILLDMPLVGIFIFKFTLKYMLGNVYINVVRTPILLGGGEPPIKFSKEGSLIGTRFLEGLLGKRG